MLPDSAENPHEICKQYSSRKVRLRLVLIYATRPDEPQKWQRNTACPPPAPTCHPASRRPPDAGCPASPHICAPAPLQLNKPIPNVASTITIRMLHSTMQAYRVTTQRVLAAIKLPCRSFCNRGLGSNSAECVTQIVTVKNLLKSRIYIFKIRPLPNISRVLHPCPQACNQPSYIPRDWR